MTFLACWRRLLGFLTSPSSPLSPELISTTLEPSRLLGSAVLDEAHRIGRNIGVVSLPETKREDVTTLLGPNHPPHESTWNAKHRPFVAIVAQDPFVLANAVVAKTLSSKCLCKTIVAVVIATFGKPFPYRPFFLRLLVHLVYYLVVFVGRKEGLLTTKHDKQTVPSCQWYCIQI